MNLRGILTAYQEGVMTAGEVVDELLATFPRTNRIANFIQFIRKTNQQGKHVNEILRILRRIIQQYRDFTARVDDVLWTAAVQ